MSNSNFSVLTVPVTELASRLARAHVLGRASAWQRMTHFLQAAAAEAFTLSDAAVAIDGQGRIGWAVVAVRSEGGTSLLILGPVPAPDRHVGDDLLARTLRLLADAELSAGQSLVQALLSPQQTGEAQLLAAGQFTCLAELIYMQADLPSPPPTDRPHWPVQPGDRIECWSEQSRPAFAAAIQASYVNTLDCPGLEGLRRIDDVIAGHMASGIFRPDLWFLFRRGDQPLGVVLLNEVADQTRGSVELVYMGLADAARGQGIGKAALLHAMAHARRLGYQRIMLAVDTRNVPALRLYHRLGFEETMRRVAWIWPPPVQ